MASGLTFTGLASGVDTDAIVRSLMRLERMPQQRLQARVDSSAARLAGFQDVRAKLDALRGASQGLAAAGVFAPGAWASSSDPTRLTATATAAAVQASYDVEVLALARAEVRTQSTSLAAAGSADVLHLGAGTSFDVAVAAGDSIADIAGKINAAGGDVAASVADGKLRLIARETGAAHAVSVSSDGALAGALGITTTLAAADAHLRVDGVDHWRGSNTVDDVVAGATLQLRATTGSAPLRLETDPAHVDTEAIVGRVKTFVAGHNALVDALREGGDASYASILDRVQRAVTDPVAGAVAPYDQAAEIGLSTGASTGTFSADALSGRLVLDETRLRAALTADPAAVERLLTGTGGTREQQGLATRLRSLATDATGAGGAIAGRIETENRRVADWRDQIERMGGRLDLREELLRRQFTAMERALGQLRSLQVSLPFAV